MSMSVFDLFKRPSREIERARERERRGGKTQRERERRGER